MQRLRVILTTLLAVSLVAACTPAPTSLPTSPSTIATQAPTIPILQSPTGFSAQPTPQGPWVEASPQAVSPGGTITLDGFLPGGPDLPAATDNEALKHANVCWQGCQDGLVMQGLPVTWSAAQPGHFTIQFQAPSVPWLQTDGPHPVATGDYLVGVQCLGLDQKGCALNEALASTTVHLETSQPSKCASTDCAVLNLQPASGQPGQELKVSGWAPLDQVIGVLAFGYSLVFIPKDSSVQPVPVASVDQNLDGSFSATMVIPQSLPGLGTLQPGSYTLGLQAARPQGVQMVTQASFDISGGLAWNEIVTSEPLWIHPSSDLQRPIFTNPNYPGWVAYCDSGSIRITRDDGRSWQSIPTSPVIQVADSMGYSLGTTADESICTSVVMDPTHTNSYYATFQTSQKDAGAPPVYFMGFYTMDGGKSWKSVPLPDGADVQRFGGFWTDTQVVEAFYSGNGGTPEQPAQVISVETADGGNSWQPAPPACWKSQGGPCVRWGPAASMISGMGSPAPQPVMVSKDNGATWSYPGLSVELRMVGPNQLAAFSDQLAALISAGADFPVRVSQDGGQTWTAVSLPPLSPAQSGMPFPGLQLLPDGSLLALPEGGSWQALPLGATQWCPVIAKNVPNQVVTFYASDGSLWWLDMTASPAKINSLPISAMKCS